MKIIPCLSLDKEKLKEIMKREILVIRNLLTSLQDEHAAITNDNDPLFEMVMDERINIVCSFEEYSEKLVSLTIKLAELVNVKVENSESLRHSEAINLLDKCLSPDDFELISFKNQIDALILEVYHQNDVNAYMLKNKPLLSRKNLPYQEIKSQAKAKITVAVLDR